MALPTDLPRVERVIPCAPEQCQCPSCGQPRGVIGYETSEQLDVELAKYFVLVIKREKRACQRCEQGGVAAAAAPQRIIEKGLVSDRVVIDTVIAKYSDHLPLYRQSVMLERETGLEISRATLAGRDGPKKFLAGFNGILQTDGYAVYDKVGGPKLVHAACWSHSRRKFYEAHQVCPDESVAKGIVLRIDDLFGIDAAARTQNLESAARDQLRQQAWLG